MLKKLETFNYIIFVHQYILLYLKIKTTALNYRGYFSLIDRKPQFIKLVTLKYLFHCSIVFVVTIYTYILLLTRGVIFERGLL